MIKISQNTETATLWWSINRSSNCSRYAGDSVRGHDGRAMSRPDSRAIGGGKEVPKALDMVHKRFGRAMKRFAE